MELDDDLYLPEIFEELKISLTDGTSVTARFPFRAELGRVWRVPAAVGVLHLPVNSGPSPVQLVMRMHVFVRDPSGWRHIRTG